jgi:cellulose synthase/poly-beta-1,6-N-acetylglucosamine synthase-like glycosyltransferase
MSILIPAYNEEEVIAEKIGNCLALDYPPERLEITVLSDGSTDRTVERARAAVSAAQGGVEETPSHRATVRVIEHPSRRGKTAVLNEAVPEASGEIVIHTDANSMLASDALTRIAVPFQDPRVGCVVGQLLYTNTDELAVSGGEGLYWRYENFIKESESHLGSTITANGGIYALRRAVFEPLPLHIAGDAADPLIVLRRGGISLFERRAKAYERAAATLREEFGRKKRIITQGLGAYVWMRGLLSPLRPWPAFELLSHKLLRWVVPIGLLAALAVNTAVVVMGRSLLFELLLVGQVAFYLVALAGIALASRRARRPEPAALPVRLASLAGYFCVVNAAALGALWAFARGVKLPTWEKSTSTRSA